MRLVHYYRDLTRPSGVTAAIAAWQEASSAAGIDTIALHNGEFGDWGMPGTVVKHVGRGRQKQVPRLRAHLRKGDVLILHEGWVTSNYVAALSARLASIPYIVVPHGVYEMPIRAALVAENYGRLQAERQYLQSAAAVHAFFETEQCLAKSIAPSAKTIVYPTGFEVPKERWTGGGNYYAWFGRYAPDHKGIDRMFRALAAVPPHERLPLQMRGVDYQDGKRTTNEMVSQMGLQEWVSVGPPVQGDDKLEFLRQCDAFLFPSRWESQGIALLEAMALGTPAVISDSIHIAPSIRAAAAAEVVDFNDSHSSAAALTRARRAPELAANSRRYVAEQLSWPGIIEGYKATVETMARTASNSHACAPRGRPSSVSRG
jgi:glycosyltransferase involved in cell wall biosynthesis